MRGQPPEGLGIEAVYLKTYFGLGTTGGETASLARDRSVNRLLEQMNLAGTEREYVRGLLQQLFRLLILDSDNSKKRELQPAFGGNDPERIEFPPSYDPVASPGGHEMIEGQDTLPYRHMKEFVSNHVELLKKKSANSEAQSCRLYGLANAYADILRLDEQIKTVLAQMRNFVNSQAWGELLERGVPLSADTTFVDICGSGAGGQATSLFVLVLVLLNLRLPLARASYKIEIDFMLPGFLRASKEAVGADQGIKSLSVLSDVLALKAGRTVEIPHPQGKLTFGGARALDVYDQLYVHPPLPTTADAFGSFVSRVAGLMVDRALSPYADDWHTSVANDPYLASVPELI